MELKHELTYEIQLEIICFNRTFMELKLKIYTLTWKHNKF